MGQPEAALRLLREADLAARSAAIPVSTRAQVALSQGDVALEFGNLADADSHYSDAVNLYRSAADTFGLASALEAKASLLHSRGDDRAALKAASNASEIRRRYNDQRAASLSDLLVGGIQMSSGDVKAARVTLSRARSTFRRLGDAAGESAALAEMGDLWRKSGNLDSATTAYRSGLNRLGNRQATDVRWRLHAGLGEALRAKGLRPDAGREFRAAIALSESTAASIHLDERRSGFMSDKWDVYGALALLELGRGHIGDAFDVSERMRARPMLELLARGRVSATPEAREEQDLRRRIATLTARLAASTATSASVRESPMDLHARTLTRDELDKAQKQYAANLLRLRDSDPAYASAVSAKTRSWKEIASRLQRDQALLEYLITDSATWVFVLTSDTVAAVDLKIRGDDISNLVDLARRAIEAPANPDRPPLWPIPLRRLYSVLIRPVEDARYLRGKRTLLIAPHGELHFLSFASLVGPPPDSRFLVDRFDILYAPSATIWSELGRRRRTQLPPGILAMAPHAQRLPGTRREVEAIRRIYGTGAHVSTENAATSAALRSGIAQASVVHLATFGVLNKHNPLFSFIELAPTRDEDGHLDVNEVFGLRMSGQLVILSACQTALGSGAIGDVPPGDDWVGLVQAFLQAGASSVVASLWPVDDRATSDLMTVMHRNLRRGASPARALADAQRQLRRQQRTSHPFYWAAFTASGG
jgi:CHAT domain-containing protein